MAQAKELMGSGVPSAAAKATVGGFSVVAAAGTTQGTAAALNTVNRVTASPSNTGVILPSTAQGSQVGDRITVFSGSATAIVLYTATGESINAVTSGVITSYTWTQYQCIDFVRVSSTTWAASIA